MSHLLLNKPNTNQGVLDQMGQVIVQYLDKSPLIYECVVVLRARHPDGKPGGLSISHNAKGGTTAEIDQGLRNLLGHALVIYQGQENDIRVLQTVNPLDMRRDFINGLMSRKRKK